MAYKASHKTVNHQATTRLKYRQDIRVIHFSIATPLMVIPTVHNMIMHHIADVCLPTLALRTIQIHSFVISRASSRKKRIRAAPLISHSFAKSFRPQPSLHDTHDSVNRIWCLLKGIFKINRPLRIHCDKYLNQ